MRKATYHYRIPAVVCREQREEEALMRTILDKINPSAIYPSSLYHIDQEMERSMKESGSRRRGGEMAIGDSGLVIVDCPPTCFGRPSFREGAGGGEEGEALGL